MHAFEKHMRDGTCADGACGGTTTSEGSEIERNGNKRESDRVGRRRVSDAGSLPHKKRIPHQNEQYSENA